MSWNYGPLWHILKMSRERVDGTYVVWKPKKKVDYNLIKPCDFKEEFELGKKSFRPLNEVDTVVFVLVSEK